MNDEYDTAAEATYWLVTVNRTTGKTTTTGPHSFHDASEAFMRTNDPAHALLMVEAM